MNIDTSNTKLEITLGGTLTAGSGIGASGAGCIALARALDDEFNLNHTIEEINHFGWEGEHAYHGTPSGIDNTASCYGGLLKFWMEDEKAEFTSIKIKGPINIVLANSGVTADTSKLGQYLRDLKAKDPAFFKERINITTEQSEQMIKALEAYDLPQVGRLMNENHKVLNEMDLSHSKIIEMSQMALKAGALGAKVTGGGRGGFMVALTPEKEVQQKVADVLAKEGYVVIPTCIG